MDKDKQVIHKLKCISVISFIFMTVEIMGGLMANSIAILADAFHLLSDVLAYIISLQAVLMSHRIPPFFMTFGYEKIQPLGALINVAIIWFVTLELVIQATQRIINKSVVQDPLYMLLTSFFGLGCNLYIMKVLHGDVEHGGHQGCSHAHGLEHHHDHGHDHKHDHKHEHKHGEKCSHGHSHVKEGDNKKKAIVKEKKKCNHTHGHHQEHDHTHTHNHDQEHEHDHDHDHDHHDHNHDHDHQHQHEHQHKHNHGNDHKHGPSCNHHTKPEDASDSSRDINAFQSDKESLGNDSYKPTISISQESLNEEINLNSHITYKPELNEENLSDQSLRIARKQQARKELFANINIQAAYVHIISDIILSIGVIISALIIYFNADREQWTFWQLADPFCTYLFSVMAIYSTVGVTKDSVIILLDGCDDANMLKDIISQLDEMEDIEQYKQLRVWSLNRAKFAGAVKIYLSEQKFNNHKLRDQIRDRVVALFAVRSISHYVQISQEPQKEIKSE